MFTLRYDLDLQIPCKLSSCLYLASMIFLSENLNGRRRIVPSRDVHNNIKVKVKVNLTKFYICAVVGVIIE